MSNSKSKTGLQACLIRFKLHRLTTNSQGRKHRILLGDFKAQKLHIKLGGGKKKNCFPAISFQGSKKQGILKTFITRHFCPEENRNLFQKFPVRHQCYHPLCREFLNVLLLSCFSRVQLCATPQTAAHQAPLSLGFSRQEHWSGLPFPSPMHESEKGK